MQQKKKGKLVYFKILPNKQAYKREDWLGENMYYA